ncbi:MAG TPA: hypothetical protein VM865_03660, partial [Acidobacteriaceae bacterium]|nr:hypothetical protein [Acidobacteriaceae bacterium]
MIGALAAGGSAQTPPLPTLLSAGTALERAVTAGDIQLFAAELAAGGSYLLAVEQRGIHLVVDVRGPDGESFAAVDSPLDRWGIENVLLQPAVPGTYRVEVRAEKKGVGSGRCAIRLDEIPESVATSAAGRERISALAAMMEAGTILRREPTGSLDK